jgi:hypothetical protein
VNLFVFVLMEDQRYCFVQSLIVHITLCVWSTFHQHSSVYMHHMFILIQNLWAFAPWILCSCVFVVLCVFCFVLIFGN